MDEAGESRASRGKKKQLRESILRTNIHLSIVLTNVKRLSNQHDLLIWFTKNIILKREYLVCMRACVCTYTFVFLDVVIHVCTYMYLCMHAPVWWLFGCVDVRLCVRECEFFYACVCLSMFTCTVSAWKCIGRYNYAIGCHARLSPSSCWPGANFLGSAAVWKSRFEPVRWRNEQTKLAHYTTLSAWRFGLWARFSFLKI